MTRPYSAINVATARAIRLYIEMRGSRITLDKHTWLNLAERGLSRQEVRRAIDDLVADGVVEIGHDTCCQIVVRLRSAAPIGRKVVADFQGKGGLAEIK